MHVWLELVGWIGSILLVASLLQTRILRLRLWNLIACLVLVFYNAMVGVWPMLGVNLALAAINLVYLAKMLGHRHDPHEFRVVAISVDEPLLADVLQRHEDDIRHLFPQRPENLLAGDDGAYFVLRGDERMGIVPSAPTTTAHEEQLLIDYVLPPYRDFTPGEFVFGPQGPFVARGVRTVVAPPGVRESERYLQALGFRSGPAGPTLTLGGTP